MIEEDLSWIQVAVTGKGEQSLFCFFCATFIKFNNLRIPTSGSPFAQNNSADFPWHILEGRNIHSKLFTSSREMIDVFETCTTLTEACQFARNWNVLTENSDLEEPNWTKNWNLSSFFLFLFCFLYHSDDPHSSSKVKSCIVTISLGVSFIFRWLESHKVNHHSLKSLFQILLKVCPAIKLLVFHAVMPKWTLYYWNQKHILYRTSHQMAYE